MDPLIWSVGPSADQNQHQRTNAGTGWFGLVRHHPLKGGDGQRTKPTVPQGGAKQRHSSTGPSVGALMGGGLRVLYSRTLISDACGNSPRGRAGKL